MKIPQDYATPANPPARVILVGCGAVARLFYAPALVELEKHGIAVVSALADPCTESSHSLAIAFPRAEVFKHTDAALASGGHLAIIASPPKSHRQHTIAAFEAGLDVLCEKPMAGSLQDCEIMIEAARCYDRILAVGHYKRFFPVHCAIKHFIQHNTFGGLGSVAIAEGGKFAWPAASDSFFRKEQTPGGVLLDIGVHVLDLLLWWLGEPAEFTYKDDALDGLEANALLNASFSEGITVTVRLSRDWETMNTYTFQFDRATVILRVNKANQTELTFDDLPMTFAAELREPFSAGSSSQTPPLDTNSQAFIAQLIDVIGSIQGCRPPRVGGTEGIRAIRWIESCYACRQSLGTSWLKELRTKDTCVSR